MGCSIRMKRFVFLSLSLLLVLITGCTASQSTPTSPPVIIAFSASPSSINPGETIKLLWNVTGATSVIIDPGIGQVDIVGTMHLQPSQSTTYTINAFNAAGVVTKTAEVTVTAGSPPSIINFTATPSTIIAGQTSTLQWNVTGSTYISIDHGIGKVDVAGTKVVTASTTTIYTISASNPAGSVSKSVAITVGTAGPTTINSSGSVNAPATITIPSATTSKPVVTFTASPSKIKPGQSATLQWNVTGSTYVSIDNGIGIVNASDSKSESPITTTTYVLTATNANGPVTASATITVGSLPVIKSFTATPRVISGQSATLQWNVTGSTYVSIDNGIGIVNASGTQAEAPTTTTTYVLTATNDNGSVTASVNVTVTLGHSWGDSATYTNDAVGFTVQYPATWQVETPGAATTVIQAAVDPSNAIGDRLYIDVIPAATDLGTVAKSLLDASATFQNYIVKATVISSDPFSLTSGSVTSATATVCSAKIVIYNFYYYAISATKGGQTVNVMGATIGGGSAKEQIQEICQTLSFK